MDIRVPIIEDKEEIYDRVKSVLGVPKVLLDEESIVSPEFIIKADNYIKKRLKDVYSLIDDTDKSLLEIAYIYYVTYLIAPTMPTRLPKAMKNISTETTLQTIDWLAYATEMLNRCNDILEDLAEEYGEETSIGVTMIDLTNQAPYPNELA